MTVTIERGPMDALVAVLAPIEFDDLPLVPNKQ